MHVGLRLRGVWRFLAINKSGGLGFFQVLGLGDEGAKVLVPRRSFTV